MLKIDQNMWKFIDFSGRDDMILKGLVIRCKRPIV